jgi:hypothetical protein
MSPSFDFIVVGGITTLFPIFLELPLTFYLKLEQAEALSRQDLHPLQRGPLCAFSKLGEIIKTHLTSFQRIASPSLSKNQP